MPIIRVSEADILLPLPKMQISELGKPYSTFCNLASATADTFGSIYDKRFGSVSSSQIKEFIANRKICVMES